MTNVKTIWKLNANTATAKDLKPNSNILLNEIFKPIPAIAITNNILDNCCIINNKFSGIKLKVTSNENITNPVIK